MSKYLKNSLLVLTLVCAVALVAFSAQLIMLNRNGADNASGEPSANESEAFESDETSDTRSLPLKGTDDFSTNGEVDEPIDETPGAPTGTRFDMQVSNGKTLVWFVDDEQFEYVPMDSGVIFYFLDEDEENESVENASIEICLAHIPYGAEARAETFLDEYLEGNDAHVGGMGQIRQSQLSGVFVSGIKEDETFEAWIHSIEDDEYDDMGVAFIIRYRDNGQRNALYEILDTVIFAES